MLERHFCDYFVDYCLHQNLVANVVFFVIRTAHFWATFREPTGFVRETKPFVECLCTRSGRGNKWALMCKNDSVGKQMGTNEQKRLCGGKQMGTNEQK